MPRQEHPDKAGSPARTRSNLKSAVRPARSADREGIVAIAQVSGLFPPEELHEVKTLIDGFFNNQLGQNHFLLTSNAGNVITGVAYYAPEPMTRGTWNLHMLLVSLIYQGQGHGRALVRFVEDALLKRGERMLLIETGSLPVFERARCFYRSCGYQQEACIRDFYDHGTDKIVSRKLLRELAEL